MVTLAQRMEQLRTERNLSRPALAAALGFPRMAVEKFETGRQTPTQEQQKKIADYFGVSLPYLRGENDDPARMDDWMDGAFLDVAPAAPAPAPRREVKAAKAAPGESAVFDAFITSKKFQEVLRSAVLETLQSPQGQELLGKAIRRALEQNRISLN